MDSSSATARLLQRYPEHAATATRFNHLRATEYPYLDEHGHVYLDYAGAGLSPRSLQQQQQQLQQTQVLGNPHSGSATSRAATELVERARARILAHFGASSDEYTVVFTANATAAARLVGESYPWREGVHGGGARLVMTADNHNSVNGLRMFAERCGAETVYVPFSEGKGVKGEELRVDEADVMKALSSGGGSNSRSLSSFFSCLGGGGGRKKEKEEKSREEEVKGEERGGGSSRKRRGLFAYPAQSNFSGARHPLSWVSAAQTAGYDVLLDAAAYLSCGTLDLSPSSTARPEFVMVSWYKLFGRPTGVGCLLARRSALARLRRPWFAGGTVRAASVSLRWHLVESGGAAFEDGTLNFVSIPEVACGLDWLAGVGVGVGAAVGGGGGDGLGAWLGCLTRWMLERLRALAHSDGRPMVVVYGPTGAEEARGATVCFNVIDAGGAVVDDRVVATESAEAVDVSVDDEAEDGRSFGDRDGSLDSSGSEGGREDKGARRAQISLRTGCFCNPGAGEAAFGLARRPGLLGRLVAARAASYEAFARAVDEKRVVVGAVRVSLGTASVADDVDALIGFLVSRYRDRVVSGVDLPPRTRC